MHRGTEQTFFQRKHVNCLQGHEKVLTLITNLEKGMATQYSCPENPINKALIDRGTCRATVHAKFGHN